MSRTILITGVGKRIGFALASYFLEQGHKVLGTYRTHYPSIEQLAQRGATLIQCELTDDNAIAALIKQAQTMDNLDTIIHNASDWLPDNAHNMSPSQIMQQMMQVHVGAPYQINLALAAKLKQDANDIGGSSIIHFTDYVAEKGSKKHMAYAASKAALHNLTLSFASLLAPQVTVNSIAPAMILFNEHDDDAYKVNALAKAILPKEAGLEEIVQLVEYLRNSQYVTGRSYAVDGGRHLR
ncbi:dihydromonapterin reductase [Shewanella intestini]|uniref:Dihydromonapterin reductase n=1 Tax=Shewanella intestini TaxID=2017544 RepID=A0ABS5I1V0_9GAMM|nr:MULTISPECIES: dihydromonapterin reductase [Shewanella]MBR9727992.1 dihydromonapterin reductase [Shewanella intestini]MRG36457.1 dihydromonapterin reductase [Shewanella sp. XMDDZSB0408]